MYNLDLLGVCIKNIFPRLAFVILTLVILVFCYVEIADFMYNFQSS